MVQYNEITQTFSNEGTRNEVRKRVVQVLLEEIHGTAVTGGTSRNKYFVETLLTGDRVFFIRPAHLHFGFDFKIGVENQNYNKKGKPVRIYPAHTDIAADLVEKKQTDTAMYAKFYSLLEKVFQCHDVYDYECSDINFNVGLTPDHILKVLKWLFIEQDIRYWYGQGRYMTWNIIPSP